MQDLTEHTTIKLGRRQHMLTQGYRGQLRSQSNRTLSQGKYRDLSYVRLQLKDVNGLLISNLEDYMRTLRSYGANIGIIVYVNDINPQIHPQSNRKSRRNIQVDHEPKGLRKHISHHLRKWKRDFIKNNPEYLAQKQSVLQSSSIDPASLKQQGINLNQGPPGTGKTKTVLGTLSALLQSSINREEDSQAFFTEMENLIEKSQVQYLGLESLDSFELCGLER